MVLGRLGRPIRLGSVRDHGLQHLPLTTAAAKATAGTATLTTATATVAVASSTMPKSATQPTLTSTANVHELRPELPVSVQQRAGRM